MVCSNGVPQGVSLLLVVEIAGTYSLEDDSACLLFLNIYIYIHIIHIQLLPCLYCFFLSFLFDDRSFSFSYLQKRVLNFGRAFLEVGRSSIFHQRSALARTRFCQASRTKIKSKFQTHWEKICLHFLCLQLMACDMIESCITRTDSNYQSWLKKGSQFISCDYQVPSEMCAMVNVVLDAKNQSFKLCAVDGHNYHTKMDDLIERTISSMTQGMVAKLISVLESVLSKLGRYDEGSFIGSILSFTVRNSLYALQNKVQPFFISVSSKR